MPEQQSRMPVSLYKQTREASVNLWNETKESFQTALNLYCENIDTGLAFCFLCAYGICTELRRLLVRMRKETVVLCLLEDCVMTLSYR